MRISDWSTDVCSSDLERVAVAREVGRETAFVAHRGHQALVGEPFLQRVENLRSAAHGFHDRIRAHRHDHEFLEIDRSEEHTSELQSLMRISYAVFCLKKNKSLTAILYTQNTY